MPRLSLVRKCCYVSMCGACVLHVPGKAGPVRSLLLCGRRDGRLACHHLPSEPPPFYVLRVRESRGAHPSCVVCHACSVCVTARTQCHAEHTSHPTNPTTKTAARELASRLRSPHTAVLLTRPTHPCLAQRPAPTPCAVHWRTTIACSTHCGGRPPAPPPQRWGRPRSRRSAHDGRARRPGRVATPGGRRGSRRLRAPFAAGGGHLGSRAARERHHLHQVQTGPPCAARNSKRKVCVRMWSWAGASAAHREGGVVVRACAGCVRCRRLG